MALAGGGCATAPQPISRIVNGRLVMTRAVSPEAYEHVTRAYLYEEEQRWQEAADEFQRVLPFNPDAAEVRAELAELFIRLGRRDDAADEVARSLAIAPTVVGFLAQAHLAEVRSETSHQPASNPIPSLEQAARLALADADAEQIEMTHLELADVRSGRSTCRPRWRLSGVWCTRLRRPSADGCSWRRWPGRWTRATRRARR